MARGDGYEDTTAEDLAERGQRVAREESDENDLHPLARQAVVEVRGRAAQVKAEAKRR